MGLNEPRRCTGTVPPWSWIHPGFPLSTPHRLQCCKNIRRVARRGAPAGSSTAWKKRRRVSLRLAATVVRPPHLLQHFLLLSNKRFCKLLFEAVLRCLNGCREDAHASDARTIGEYQRFSKNVSHIKFLEGLRSSLVSGQYETQLLSDKLRLHAFAAAGPALIKQKFMLAVAPFPNSRCKRRHFNAVPRDTLIVLRLRHPAPSAAGGTHRLALCWNAHHAMLADHAVLADQAV